MDGIFSQIGRRFVSLHVFVAVNTLDVGSDITVGSILDSITHTHTFTVCFISHQKAKFILVKGPANKSFLWCQYMMKYELNMISNKYLFLQTVVLYTVIQLEHNMRLCSLGDMITPHTHTHTHLASLAWWTSHCRTCPPHPHCHATSVTEKGSSPSHHRVGSPWSR